MHKWLGEIQDEVFREIRQRTVVDSKIVKLNLTSADFADATRYCPKENDKKV